MKFLKQSVAVFTFFLMTYLFAPDFPSVQVSTVWILTDQDLTAIKNTKIDNTSYEYPIFLAYVKENAPPFEYLLDENLKQREDFDKFPPKYMFAWLNNAMNTIKTESFMKTVPLIKQKNIGVEIINTVTNTLLQKYCNNNETIQNDSGRKNIILGNAPIQINSYLSLNWVEDWLKQARAKMKWDQLEKIFGSTGNNVDAVFKEQEEPYTTRMEWVCNALKAAQNDIKEQQNNSDPDLNAYCTSIGKQGSEGPYIAYALKDAKKRIEDKAIELITPKLPTEKVDETIQDIRTNIKNAFSKCGYQKDLFGPEYTQKWVNLDEYIKKNPVTTKTITVGNNKQVVGVLTDKWLNSAIDAAKKDRDAEKINLNVATTEATKKIRDAILHIQDKDYQGIGTAVETGLSEKTTAEHLIEFGSF